MTRETVRSCLRRACEEIEDVCEDVPVSNDHRKRLERIVEQLRYHVDGNWSDPEASVSPDPNALDTIRNHLAEVNAETEGEAAVQLERARDDLLRATSKLNDRQEKRRGPGNRLG